MNKTLASLAIFSFAFIARVACAQEIGTLFTTPEERAYLNFLREEFLLNSQANDFNIEEVVPAVPVIEDETESAPEVSFYSLGGVFVRQDGTRTVWLNNQAISGNNLPTGMQLISGTSADTLLRIQIDSGIYDLRAGQSLDVLNAQVLESWQLPQPEQEDTGSETAVLITDALSNENAQSQVEENNVVLDQRSTEAAEDTNITSPTEGATVSLDEITALIEAEGAPSATDLIQQLQDFEEAQVDANTQQ